MAWTSPITAVVGAALTAAEFNASIRDNLLATMPGQSDGNTGFFVNSAVNEITKRVPVSVVSTQDIFFDPDGPGVFHDDPFMNVTVETGTQALVHISADVDPLSGTEGFYTGIAFNVTGASSRPPSLDEAIIFTERGLGLRSHYGVWNLVTDLTPGENTFAMSYVAEVDTTGRGMLIYQREIIVVPLS